jgi:hypothetical protein
MRILKELRASQFVNADSKALAESGFLSRDGRDRVSEWEFVGIHPAVFARVASKGVTGYGK